MGHPAVTQIHRGKKPASKRENWFWITHAANISLLKFPCPPALDCWDSLLVNKGTAGNRSVEQSECWRISPGLTLYQRDRLQMNVLEGAKDPLKVTWLMSKRVQKTCVFRALFLDNMVSKLISKTESAGQSSVTGARCKFVVKTDTENTFKIPPRYVARSSKNIHDKELPC